MTSTADTRLDRTTYLEHVRTETDKFMSAAGEENFAQRVPSCPEWNVYELSLHVWQVFTFWWLVVENRLTDLREIKRFDRTEPELGDLRDAVRDRSDALIGALAGAEPSESICSCCCGAASNWTTSMSKVIRTP